MTTISRDDVLALARLSSLLLDESEIDGLQSDLDRIISYVNQLSELDTGGVTPTYQVSEMHNIWRDDVVQAGIDSQVLVALAPESHDNQIKVPKVL